MLENMVDCAVRKVAEVHESGKIFEHLARKKGGAARTTSMDASDCFAPYNGSKKVWKLTALTLLCGPGLPIYLGSA